MNLFNEISDFFGEHKKGELKELSDSFWNTARAIRTELGEDAHVLDSYLTSIFSTIVDMNMNSIVIHSEYLFGDLYQICSSICESKDKVNIHNFYDTAYDYIVSHPLPYDNLETKIYIYFMALLDKFIDVYVEKLCEKIDLKFEDIKINFKKIIKIVGTEKINNLNYIIKQRFLTPFTKDIFISLIICDMCYYLLKDDKQTSKKIFQLILEQNFKLY